MPTLGHVTETGVHPRHGLQCPWAFDLCRIFSAQRIFSTKLPAFAWYSCLFCHWAELDSASHHLKPVKRESEAQANKCLNLFLTPPRSRVVVFLVGKWKQLLFLTNFLMKQVLNSAAFELIFWEFISWDVWECDLCYAMHNMHPSLMILSISIYNSIFPRLCATSYCPSSSW